MSLSITILISFDKNHYQSSQILGSADWANELSTFPSKESWWTLIFLLKQVTGSNTEAQVLLALRVYKDKENLLSSALNHLFQMLRYEEVRDQCQGLEVKWNKIQTTARLSVSAILRLAPLWHLDHINVVTSKILYIDKRLMILRSLSISRSLSVL